MVLLSAQGMDVAGIARVAFTSPDRVREVINNFNEDGFESLYPRYSGGRPPTFTLPQRQEIKKVALSRPVDHGLPFSTWSLAKLAEFLVAEGVVDDISHEGLEKVLKKEQRVLSSHKDLQAVRRPRLRAQEEPGAGAVRHRRGQSRARRRRPDSGDLHGRVRPAQLGAPAGQQWAPVGRRADKGATWRRGGARRATYKRTRASATCSPRSTCPPTRSTGT